MAYRNNPSILNRDVSKTGLTSPSDVYDIIVDNIEQISEFYEFEPAIVIESKIPNYDYYGTIRARFVYSQSEGDEIDGIIKPLSPHITVYPLKGEVVNIAKHGGQYYYYNPLNLRNQVNMNRAGGELGEGLVFPKRTSLNRRLAPNQGDLVLNGRFGQGIKFGSDAEDYKHPNIKIVNKQSVYAQQLLDKDYLIKEIESLEGRNVDNKYYNFTILNNNNKINIFFNNKNYNLIGWQTEDIYQNLAITFISKIKTNQKIDKKIFEIPKMKMN